MLLTMERLKALDLRAYNDAVNLRGTTPAKLGDLMAMVKSNRLKRVFDRLEEDGTFEMILSTVKVIEGRHHKTARKEAILGMQAVDTEPRSEDIKTGIYVMIENGCLLEVTKKKVVLISEIEKLVDEAYVKVETGIREHHDYLEGKWFQFTVCGEFVVRNALESILSVDRDDEMTEFIKEQMINEAENKERELKIESLQKGIAKTKELIEEFETKLTEQNSGFNKNIEQELITYRNNIEKILKAKKQILELQNI